MAKSGTIRQVCLGDMAVLSIPAHVVYLRDLSQGANKINFKRTLTIQKIFDFLGAPCKPIGPL